LVKAKYFDIEATKLQTAQAEEAKKGFTLKQDILDETKAIAEGIVTRDQYAEQLTKLADLHKKFVDGNKTSGISDTEFKAAAANLTDNFNKSVDAAKGATDEMSVYAQQAAKNMQDAFANFLFDPFKDGVSGLADNFATALRQMAAQYLSSQLFDYLKSGFGSASGGSSSGSGVDWGGVFSKVGSLFSAAAKDGYAFQGGNIIPFASGGIVGRATPFGMSGGRRGVMGEAGPEAIMPLRRDSQGRLGIAGGGQAVTIVQNMHFGNNADGNTVRKAAGQGAREAMSAISGTQRYR
jgi:lambda family phage tail tape measure protein